jgi:DNA methylase
VSRVRTRKRPEPSGSIHRVSSPMGGRTQEALYSEIDLELSWSEAELPQAARTKHVHGLHPYLGKYVPQLVEIFLTRFFRPGQCVYDPFVGSGTTLVEANVFGADGVGCDISAFNCLLSRVKTTPYALGTLEMSLKAALEDARQAGPAPTEDASDWLRKWYAPRTLGELLRYHEVASERLDDPAWDVARIILSRAARSARLTTHFDLDFPRAPTTATYFCHKHKRTCRPVEQAEKFLSRYTLDTVRRVRAFAELRTNQDVGVLHDDARVLRLPRKCDGIITSPPYPGLIDYHEQHRYSYELLKLHDRREDEIGAATEGTSSRAIAAYVADMTAVFANAAEQLTQNAPIVVVVNDSRNLYPAILRGAGLRLEDKITRHVNRRTGRRAGEFFESILVCRVGTA